MKTLDWMAIICVICAGFSIIIGRQSLRYDPVLVRQPVPSVELRAEYCFSDEAYGCTFVSAIGTKVTMTCAGRKR